MKNGKRSEPSTTSEKGIMADVHNINNQNDPSQWFKTLPIVTQAWFGATMALTLSGNFGVVDIRYLVWSWGFIRERMELWRIVTSFCYAGPFEFNTLITIYMLLTMSQRYEQSGPFNTGAGGGTADYVFAFMFGMIMILATYPFVIQMFPMPPIFAKNMVYYVMYIWSKRHPTAQANIWGIPIEAIYLPFAYLALSVFMGGSYFDLLHGLAIGHLYYFLADVYPQVSGKDILVTPKFLIDKFGIGDYRPTVTAEVRANPQAAGAGAQAGGHTWGGAGRPLGRLGEAAPPAAAAAGGGGYTWGGGGRPLGRQ